MSQATFEPNRQGEEGRARWLGFSGFLLALGFLTFITGAFVVLEKVQPYPLLKSAHQAGKAAITQMRDYQDPLKTNLWTNAHNDDRGVTIHSPQKAYQGYTLYTSGHDSAAYLIDMNGRIAHQWRLPFSEVWNKSAAIAKPRSDEFYYFRKALPFPNGDLLVVYEASGDTPWGAGLVKIDKNSRVLWTFLERAHHDVEVGEDGRVYTLTHEIRKKPLEGFEYLEPPLIEDFLVILSADGQVEKKISLLEAQARSPYRRYLEWLPAFTQDDPQHTNSVEPIEGEAAENFPFANAGAVLLSFRATSVIAAFDPESEEFLWGTQGPWALQHDPDLLPNGKLLLFDNVGHIGPEGTSRILEMDPKTLGTEWSYVGTREKPFESNIRAAQQRLPNGNTLITESDGGRLLEVTPEGEIAWEYVNPIRGGESDERIPVVSWAQRISPDELEESFLPQ